MARRHEWWVSASAPDDSLRAHTLDGCNRVFLNLFVVANPCSNLLPIAVSALSEMLPDDRRSREVPRGREGASGGRMARPKGAQA